MLTGQQKICKGDAAFSPHWRGTRRGCSGQKELWSDISQAWKAQARKMSLGLNVSVLHTCEILQKLHQKSGNVAKLLVCSTKYPRPVNQCSIYVCPGVKTRRGLTFSQHTYDCEFIGEDLKNYFNKVLLQSVLSGKVTELLNSGFGSLCWKRKIPWANQKIRSFQEKKMPHGIPSCWNLMGKDSVACGAKVPLKPVEG